MSLPSHLYQAVTSSFGRSSVPELHVGDTIRVHQKVKEGDKERVQIFEGLVIAAKHGKGMNGSFTVRKIAAGGVGVERVFPLHLPTIVKLDRVKRARVRRAKLYYMRDRAGKSARFTNEKILTGKTWEEQLDEVVGEASAENPEKVEDTTVAETVAEEPKVEAKTEAKADEKEEPKAEKKEAKTEKVAESKVAEDEPTDAKTDESAPTDA